MNTQNTNEPDSQVQIVCPSCKASNLINGKNVWWQCIACRTYVRNMVCPKTKKVVMVHSPQMTSVNFNCPYCGSIHRTIAVSEANKQNPMLAHLVEVLPPKLGQALSQMLQPGDPVLFKLKGAFKEGLVCTESRVIILKSGFMTGQMFGTNVFQSPYRNISGVEVKFNLLSGYFELSAGGVQNVPKNCWSQERNSDPKSAPNCISLNSKFQADRFRSASAFIMSKLTADHYRARDLHDVSPKVDVLAAIEKLGQLKASGVISDAEFASKKAGL